MGKERSLSKWIGVSAIVIAVSVYGIAAQCLEKISNGPDNMRPDIVSIDNLGMYGKLERPKVDFLHDLHTKALAKKGKDCLVCHVEEEGKLTHKFKGTAGDSKKEIMENSHEACITCHKETTAAKEKSGPVECAECHVKKKEYVSSRMPVGFDNSLHARHAKAENNKCEACHHDYNEKTKKLAHVKGEEGSCRYCHKTGVEEYRTVTPKSMKDASHLACITCHQKKVAEKKDAGPVECAGCHDAGSQKMIAKLDTIPRMERNQPDATMIKIGSDKKEDVRAPLVAFDHKAHEGYNDNCRVCHHKSVESCSACHTLAGDKKGNGVTLEKAMHDVTAGQSCVGCHQTKKKALECAGCHDQMGAKSAKSEASCKVCHVKEAPEGMPKADAAKAMAAELLSARKPAPAVEDKDIPEVVTIKGLEKKYEKVEMPHRKMVKTLAASMEKSKMATYFHTDSATLCQGCHHNAPAAKKPSNCASCHGKPFDERYPDRPGLYGAYHLQCMGCHDSMGLEKLNGCTSCHKEKK